MTEQIQVGFLRTLHMHYADWLVRATIIFLRRPKLGWFALWPARRREPAGHSVTVIQSATV